MDETGEKVAFLSQSASYGRDVGAVEVRETRTSWVFLTDKHVHKLKKPLKNRHFDFSSPEGREANAREEIRLNRRLAPDVYLGVAELVRHADGALALEGPGEPTDWLVRMRRLPEAGFLDHAIVEKSVRHAQIVSLAAVLADFYARAEPSSISPAEVLASFRRQILDARMILLNPRFRLSRRCIVRLTGQLLHEARPHGLLGRRAECRPPVEGHGDLRPEHVWLGNPPVVIDCLEFNPILRLVDPYDELSFLALECERLGAAWIGPLLLATVGRNLGECPPAPILSLYRRLRAVLRASFALRHFLEALRRKPGDWHRQARDYLVIASKVGRCSVRRSASARRLR